MPVTVGLKSRAEVLVNGSNTANAVGSGLVPVFSTPSMIALMENAAVRTIQGRLEQGETSVGTHMDITHDAPTPVGVKVWAEAEVTAVEGRRVTFSVAAYDEKGPIGKGVHQRAVIRVDKFLAKANAKLNQA